MKATDAELARLGPWSIGATNVVAETSVPARALREAVNVNIDDDGTISRRDGYSLLYEEAEPYGLFAYGRRAFFASAGVLYMIEAVNASTLLGPTPLYTGLMPDVFLAHCLIEPNIYVSDGAVALRVALNGTVSEWSLPPAPAPSITIQSGGDLPAGQYSISVAYLSESGEEGPLGTATVVDVPESSSLSLGFPAAPAGASRRLVFITKPNGTELLLHGVVPSAALLAVVAQSRLGRPPVAAGTDPMPAGNYAAYYAGRLYTAMMDTLWWSEPHNYAVAAADYNYELFAEPITGLGVPGENTVGFFVGQQARTYFRRGADPAVATLEEVYPAGMVPGSLTMIPGSRLGIDGAPTEPIPTWLATNGVFCAGLPDGRVLPLTERRFAADVGERAAAVFAPVAGRNQLLVTTYNPSENNFAIRDEVAFEVVRNGITP